MVVPRENPWVWKLMDLSYLLSQVYMDLGAHSQCCEYFPQVLMRLKLCMTVFIAKKTGFGAEVGTLKFV